MCSAKLTGRLYTAKKVKSNRVVKRDGSVNFIIEIDGIYITAREGARYANDFKFYKFLFPPLTSWQGTGQEILSSPPLRTSSMGY
jgi:hypothetical protein